MNIEGIGWIAGAAFVTPYLVSYLKAGTWSTQAKRYLSIGVSIVLGAAAYGTQYGFDTMAVSTLDEALTMGGVVWALGQLVYANIVSGTALEVKVAGTKAGLSAGL